MPCTGSFGLWVTLATGLFLFNLASKDGLSGMVLGTHRLVFIVKENSFVCL